MFDDWKPYVSAAERRRTAQRELAKLAKKGHAVAPVTIEGRVIAKTFWGKSWCDNLEHYRDYDNRLPRGRAYVRNGSVVDLQIGKGEIIAWVSGSQLYKVEIAITTLAAARWKRLIGDCAGEIDSVVELLQGSFSDAVMKRMCNQETGLFPSPKEIHFICSCPDSAYMCKHVAAVFYGVGARLDARPELLFVLREVDENDLIAGASKGLQARTSTKKPMRAKLLEVDDLSEVFGLELAHARRRGKNPASGERTRKAKSSGRRAASAARSRGPSARPARSS